MSTLRRGGRLARTVLLLLVAVLGFATATVTVPASPALAGPGFRLCIPIFDEGGTKIIGWDCRWYDLPIEIRCPVCPDWGLTFEHVVNPPDWRFGEDILDGLDLLHQASLDPRQADQLRAAAELEFASATARAGDSGVRPGVVGTVDRERNAINANPVSWLVAADADLVDGLRLMRQGNRSAAMGQFEEAYQEIARQRPIGN